MNTTNLIQQAYNLINDELANTNRAYLELEIADWKHRAQQLLDAGLDARVADLFNEFGRDAVVACVLAWDREFDLLDGDDGE